MNFHRCLRSVLVSCLALLGVMVGVERAGAELSELFVASTNQILKECGAGLASVTSVRPILKYQNFNVEIGGTSFEIAGFGGIIDIDASNTPGFNNFATLITNGLPDHGLRMVREFVNMGTRVYSSEDPLPNLQTAGDQSDLAGARIAFVRLIVNGLDAGVTNELCPPTAGSAKPVFAEFVSANVRFEFWGESQVSFNLNSSGCNPCSAGQIASFFVKIANFGSPISAEVKLSVTPQTGPPIDLLGRPVKAVVPSGESNMPLASFVVPGEPANGPYLIEAALIDPVRGVTLVRDSLIAVKE